ncbi:GNAT family N-acetyltransferase [Actinopolymorpha sp. NPDC004070]|uniref:GNAT family N-acetyltransferase n=1 Tax=Actinopolymorpha sp. NPDC004070 TaxID=3154548 RepID=UPI0033BAD4AF
MDILASTERLVLRRLEPSDADNLWRLYGDPAGMGHISLPTIPRSELDDQVLPELLAEYDECPGFGHWAAETRTDREFVGWFGLHPAVPADDGLWTLGTLEDASAIVSLGYRLRRAAWGRGFATEGARALVQRAFAEVGTAEIRATTMAVNTGSRRVLEKLGFEHIRTLHLDWPDPLEGNEHGDVVYRLRRCDWPTRT